MMNQYAQAGQLSNMYVGATTAAEPEAASGSMLASLQLLDKTIAVLSERFARHTSAIDNILLPESTAIGDGSPKNIQPAEPMRSPYAARLHEAIKNLNVIGATIESTTHRVNLT